MFSHSVQIAHFVQIFGRLFAWARAGCSMRLWNSWYSACLGVDFIVPCAEEALALCADVLLLFWLFVATLCAWKCTSRRASVQDCGCIVLCLFLGPHLGYYLLALPLLAGVLFGLACVYCFLWFLTVRGRFL